MRSEGEEVQMLCFFALQLLPDSALCLPLSNSSSPAAEAAVRGPQCSLLLTADYGMENCGTAFSRITAKCIFYSC